ncbi:hypothetical protein B0H67DRAFT_197345 [Lasiosphaeris hirsuta]|uniref:Uncharacterized protein n=1 Tax=Lasiosphaeris hirsuta TaxID=260670 RepID=A0AA40ARH9_9PEZI|nr:hypothetical protein B0H67DRAFT_197345 [Lasiosphaeris hirsuta]
MAWVRILPRPLAVNRPIARAARYCFHTLCMWQRVIRNILRLFARRLSLGVCLSSLSWNRVCVADHCNAGWHHIRHQGVYVGVGGRVGSQYRTCCYFSPQNLVGSFASPRTWKARQGCVCVQGYPNLSAARRILSRLIRHILNREV